MRKVRMQLRPARAEAHTDVTISLRLARPLNGWELMELCDTLRTRSASPVRVALSADAPAAWLDQWSDALSEIVTERVEVQFVGKGSPRRRASCAHQLDLLEPSDVLRPPHRVRSGKCRS